MKKPLLIFLVLLLLCFGAVAEQRYLTMTHRSEILGKDKNFAVILPENYTEEMEYPVLYLLHGAGGGYLDWHKPNGKLYELSRQYEMIIVTPDLESSWVADSHIKKESQYESYMIKEFIPLIDETFSTIDSYRGRGVAGLSMGGHGALYLVSKYPDIFNVVSSTSGVLDIRMVPNTAGKKDVFGDPKKYPEVWDNHSVVNLAEEIKNARRRPRIMFDVGLSDYVYDTNLAYHQELKRLNIDHIFKVYPGTHAWGYWLARLPEHLEFHASNLRRAQIVSE
ncbi:MAG TPA: prolyl oligopeptidase family serine peptidase [Firmicutes bacterium]|nr:prolyl oligopeptidase family serine peptidase [Bacillota bacterium]